MKTKHFLNFSAYLSIVLLATVANAQPNSFILDKVVVSASGFEQNIDSRLRNILILQGKELEERGFLSLEQALERTANISFVDRGLGRNIDLRGQGDKANVAVKVMVDGRALNMLDNAHGVTPIESVDLTNVERIEIIPGGGAVLYGNGTRGGVINIITKKRKDDSFSFAIKGTGYDNGNFGGVLSTRIGKKISDSLSFNAFFSAFNKNGSQKASNEKGLYLGAKTFIQKDENQELIFSYNYFENTNASNGYLSKAQVQANPYQKGPDDVVTKITHPSVALEFNQFLNDTLQLGVVTFWQKHKIVYKKNISPFTMRGMTLQVDQSGSGFEDTLGGLSLKSKYNYDTNSYLVFGYDFSQHNSKSKSLASYTISPTMAFKMSSGTNMKKQSHSVFALDSHQVFDTFFLSGGVRYEYAKYRSKRYSNTGNTRTSSQFSMNPQQTQNYAFEITPQLKYSDTGSLYAKLERGFISPTPSQFVSRDNTRINGAYFLSNIKPEIYDTFELGANDFLWNFYTINASIFYTQSKDEISILMNSSAGGMSWRYYNIDKTRRYGLELSLSQIFFDEKLIVRQNFTYLDAKITQGLNKGKRIPYVAKVKADAGVQYAFNKNFSAFVDLSYASRAKDGTYTDWIKDIFLTDIGTNWTKDAFKIQAGIRNLFNRTYFTYQGGSGNEKRYGVGQGRNYYVEFKYAF